MGQSEFIKRRYKGQSALGLSMPPRSMYPLTVKVCDYMYNVIVFLLIFLLGRAFIRDAVDAHRRASLALRRSSGTDPP